MIAGKKLVRIRLGIFDFEPDLSLKPGQTKPKISDTAPTNRHSAIPSDSGPIFRNISTTIYY